MGGPRYVKTASGLDRIDLLDASFFDLGPGEAAIANPQARRSDRIPSLWLSPGSIPSIWECSIWRAVTPERGMAAYADLQEMEFDRAERAGYSALLHQRFVGTGYFDKVAQTISQGSCSVTALGGSTEQEQFG